MTYSLIPDQRLQDMLGALSNDARGEVAHAAAYALYVAVRRYVSRLARSRHGTAESLGAAPTGFLRKGARAIVCRGDAVDIPIPGFARVFHPLDIRPKRAKSLTIPINRVSYGVRAGRLASEGWSLFRVSARGGDPLRAQRRRARGDCALPPPDAREDPAGPLAPPDGRRDERPGRARRCGRHPLPGKEGGMSVHAEVLRRAVAALREAPGLARARVVAQSDQELAALIEEEEARLGGLAGRSASGFTTAIDAADAGAEALEAAGLGHYVRLIHTTPGDGVLEAVAEMAGTFTAAKE